MNCVNSAFPLENPLLTLTQYSASVPLSPCRRVLQEWTWHGIDSIVLWRGACLPGSVLARGKRKVISHKAKSTVKRDNSSSTDLLCLVFCLPFFFNSGPTGLFSVCFFYTAVQSKKFVPSHFIVTQLFIFFVYWRDYKGMRVHSRERSRCHQVQGWCHQELMMDRS